MFRFFIMRAERRDHPRMSAIGPVGIVGWDKAMMGRDVRRGRSMGSIRAGVRKGCYWGSAAEFYLVPWQE